MKKVSSKPHGGDLKRLKLDIPKMGKNSRERVPFNRSYFQFYTSTNILCSCVGSTKEIVIICCTFMKSPRFHIYTMDGHLVTTFSCGIPDIRRVKSVKMCFSDRMFVLLMTKFNFMHELLQCNEYTSIGYIIANQRRLCFDCDGNYIYVCRTNKSMCSIDLYTHDVQLFRSINFIQGSCIAIKVQSHSIFLLNSPSTYDPNSNFVTKLVQLSLTSGEKFRTFDICCSPYPRPRFISFDPQGNLIIGYTSNEKVAILHRDDIVRYHTLTDDDHSFTITSLATSITGDLVCASYLGKCIRVYPTG